MDKLNACLLLAKDKPVEVKGRIVFCVPVPVAPGKAGSTNTSLNIDWKGKGQHNMPHSNPGIHLTSL